MAFFLLDRFVECRSDIHGIGVRVLEDVDAGQLLVEYTGELIRNILVDKREAEYRKKVSFFG